MYNAANNASSQLAQAISASDTSLTVLDGSRFPDAPFVVTIEDEIIEVGSKSGNTFSGLVRGLEGTTPAAHASGARVENRFTAGTYQKVVDEIVQVVNTIDTHTGNKNNPHQVTAAQIGAATTSDLTSHINNKNNPHNVTAAQVGAAPASHVGSGGSAHALATTSAAGFMSAAHYNKLASIPEPFTKWMNYGNDVVIASSGEVYGGGSAATGGHGIKRFLVKYPGFYRMTADLKTSDSNAAATLEVRVGPSIFTFTRTSTSYGAITFDIPAALNAYGTVEVRVIGNSYIDSKENTRYTYGYMRNVSLRGVVDTSFPEPQVLQSTSNKSTKNVVY